MLKRSTDTNRHAQGIRFGKLSDSLFNKMFLTNDHASTLLNVLGKWPCHGDSRPRNQALPPGILLLEVWLGYQNLHT